MPILIIATEGMDYLPASSDCSTLKFTLSEGLQTRCSFIEILDDSIIEGDESFTLKLLSTNPQVTFAISKAIITIVDDDGEAIPTIATAVMPTGECTYVGLALRLQLYPLFAVHHVE